MARCVHYVGFRGDEFIRARRIFGGPVIIHMVMDDRVFSEVGEEDIVIIGPKGHHHCKYVDDVSSRV